MFLSDFNELEFSRQIFEKKNSNIKFHENPSSGSRVVPCRPTDRQIDEGADITKLIIAIRNYSNAPKRISSHPLFLGISLRQQA